VTLFCEDLFAVLETPLFHGTNQGCTQGRNQDFAKGGLKNENFLRRHFDDVF